MHLEMTECHIPFLGPCDVDTDLDSKIIMSGAYALQYLKKESQIWCVWKYLEVVECCVPFLGPCDLVDIDLTMFLE